MATFAASLDLLKVDLGRYPTDQEGLRLLVEPPAAERDRSRWRGPYLDAAVPSDPWDAPYVYQAPETEFARPTVKSLGADGAEGGDGLAADIIHGVPAT
jgi:general secretion pathway protein G